MATENNATMLGLIPFVALKKAEAKRAQDAVLTLVPGSPATRAALASFAVTNQARESLRREKKVADAMLGVVEGVVAGQTPAVAVAGQAALKDLAPDQLATRLTGIIEQSRDEGEGSASTGETTGEVEKAVEAATAEAQKVLDVATSMLVAAIGRTKDQLFTEDEAKPFAAYLDHVSAEDRAKIVK
jgi:hypothetical protein